jgi:hypothetical protein
MLYFCLSHSIQPKSTGNNFMTIKIDQKWRVVFLEA